MPKQRLSFMQIKEDLKSGNCVEVDGFYVYKDKIVQYTDHFGCIVIKGTYDEKRGYVVTKSPGNKRFAVSHLKAKAFLAKGKPIYSIKFKDGDNKNTSLENLIIKYKKEVKYCKDCGSLLAPNNTSGVCLKCKQKSSEYNICSEKELKKRKEQLKGLDISSLPEINKEKTLLYLKGHTLDFIAKKYGISRQAVSISMQYNVKKAEKQRKKKVEELCNLVKQYTSLNSELKDKAKSLIDLVKNLNEENARLKKFIRNNFSFTKANKILNK